MDMEFFFFLSPTECDEAEVYYKYLTDPYTSSNLLNYDITLDDLSVGRFACFVIQRNDDNNWNLIPSVGIVLDSVLIFTV